MVNYLAAVFVLTEMVNYLVAAVFVLTALSSYSLCPEQKPLQLRLGLK